MSLFIFRNLQFSSLKSGLDTNGRFDFFKTLGYLYTYLHWAFLISLTQSKWYRNSNLCKFSFEELVYYGIQCRFSIFCFFFLQVSNTDDPYIHRFLWLQQQEWVCFFSSASSSLLHARSPVKECLVPWPVSSKSPQSKGTILFLTFLQLALGKKKKCRKHR